MKLQELIDQGYALRGWLLTTLRGERRMVLKLRRDERLYIAHTPLVNTALLEMEFTEPTLLKGGHINDATIRH